MFEKEIVEFSENLESLRDFVELVDAHLEERNKNELKEDPSAFAPLMLIANRERPEETGFDDDIIDKIKESFGSEIEFTEEETENGKKFEIKLDEEGQKKFSSAMEKLSKNQARKSSLHQSSLVTIISYVEWFLAQLIHKHYDAHPSSIGLKDKQLSLNDLYEIGSVEDAKKFLIDTKVESVLRGSFNDWISFLKEKMALSMSYLKEYENVLVEACQRRNLYVHNGGIVNSIYLKNCTFQDNKQPDIDDRLLCDSEYIESILTGFEKTFLLIAAELWKKNEPENEARFNILNELSYEHIRSERYEIGSAIAYFLCGDKGQKESNRMTAQINYWQAKKWNGEFATVKEEIAASDFSAKDSIFILAKQVLMDDFDEVFKALPELLESEKLTPSQLEEWPLFRAIKLDERYKTLFSECDSDTDNKADSADEDVLH